MSQFTLGGTATTSNRAKLYTMPKAIENLNSGSDKIRAVLVSITSAPRTSAPGNSYDFDLSDSPRPTKEKMIEVYLSSIERLCYDEYSIKWNLDYMMKIYGLTLQEAKNDSIKSVVGDLISLLNRGETASEQRELIGKVKALILKYGINHAGTKDLLAALSSTNDKGYQTLALTYAPR